MRKLKTTDIANLCRVVKKLGLKDQVRAIAQTANSGADIWDKGYDLIWGLFDAATEVNGEMAIYEFLAGPFEMTAEEVRDLDLDVLFEKTRQLVAENNLSVFFKSAAAALTK